jgi:hypothetical protein
MTIARRCYFVAIALFFTTAVAHAQQLTPQQAAPETVDAASASVPASAPAPPAALAPRPPAPMRIASGARVCIQGDADVRSLVQSAFMKKSVPVTLVATCEGASFIMNIPHYEQHTDGTGVKITKLLLFGASGDNFQMDATVTNGDGVIVFAKTVKRRDSKVAAQDLAKWFGEFVKSGKIT